MIKLIFKTKKIYLKQRGRYSKIFTKTLKINWNEVIGFSKLYLLFKIGVVMAKNANCNKNWNYCWFYLCGEFVITKIILNKNILTKKPRKTKRQKMK